MSELFWITKKLLANFLYKTVLSNSYLLLSNFLDIKAVYLQKTLNQKLLIIKLIIPLENSENILIAQEEYYKIEINTSKNRLYFTTLGSWQGIKHFLHLESHWKEALSHLKPNFTVLADIRPMPIISKKLENLFSELQAYAIQNGVLHVAEVAALNDISNLQLERISNRSELPFSKFETFEEAEKHLNKLVSQI